MRISKLFYFLFAVVGIFMHSGLATALELRVSSENANPGDSIAVEITVQEYDQEVIAAAAFTVTYSADNLVLNKIESDFFSTFLEQWNSLNPVPDPLPPVSVEMNDQTYVRPLVFNTTDDTSLGKVRLAAARVRAGTPNVLFTLYFTVKNSATSGGYPLSIAPTVIKNTKAGYDEAGEAVPMLIGAIEGQANLALAYPVYSPEIVNGTVYIQQEITDIVPPEPIRNLRADNDQADLSFTWDHSLNTAGDLAAYVLTFNNEEPLILDPH
ncbi:MAG: hypothetical protein D3925_12520, partial [Candidatus Electrothrix sp. AR5]|nr:hypothetical protein [Candidatus Electrothrix sp. AR5]